MNRRVAWLIAMLVAATLVSGVAAAVLLGPQSNATVNLLGINLTPSSFPTTVSPGGTYYFNITATSTYHTDTSGVFLAVLVNDTCADLASHNFVLAEKSATYGGYAPLTGSDVSGSCRFVNVGITATVPTGGTPVIYWFRQTFTTTLPNLTWSFQAQRQN